MVTVGGGMFPPLPPFPPIPTWAEFLKREKELAETRQKVEEIWCHCVRKLERGGLAQCLRRVEDKKIQSRCYAD